MPWVELDVLLWYLSTMSIILLKNICTLHSTEKFMSEKMGEFTIGRRHLANMMGEDPSTFTQEDINVGDDDDINDTLFSVVD